MLYHFSRGFNYYKHKMEEKTERYLSGFLKERISNVKTGVYEQDRDSSDERVQG